VVALSYELNVSVRDSRPQFRDTLIIFFFQALLLVVLYTKAINKNAYKVKKNLKGSDDDV
jgi:hypothetical protein